MITPRRTRLVRVPDLRGFRACITALASPATAIVVPTRTAARQLNVDTAVTRDELYDRLHARLANPPRRLTPIERDVIAQAAARAAAQDRELTFRLRPGLVAEMLRFYDLLRRHSQQIKRFEELINEALGSDEIDRGARRMREQTRFLAAAFREYERRVSDSGAVDEHGLRERLITDASPDPLKHVLVTVSDWIADADGLFVADFDLLARVPGLESIDVVATERLLGSGFHERLHQWLPGIDEVTHSPRTVERTVLNANGSKQMSTVLATPAGSAPDEPWWVHRDREEELVAVVRNLKADEQSGDSVPLDRVAVVFKRPLPYLYLAHEVFRSAGVPFESFDALPLAAEPTVSALDLVLEAAETNFTRDSLVALLRSPHLQFDVSLASIAALDRALSDERYLGELDRLSSVVQSLRGAAAPAAQAALEAARALAPLRDAAPASEQIPRLMTFWRQRLKPLPGDDAVSDREHRARAAVDATLSELTAVHAAHHDPLWTVTDLVLAVRRAIEEQTFDVPCARGGVRLVDDRAARYGEFDDVTVVGLVESEWPERPKRNIFYPPSLLKSLGWPSEKDRAAATDAHFLDLLGSAARRTTLSVFTLEDDALVSRSIQLDEIPRARMSQTSRRLPDRRDGTGAPPLDRVFVDEDISTDPVVLDRLNGNAMSWAQMRIARTPPDENRFHGEAGALAARVWSVSALETYLGCPFRFFAQHVLRLEEEPDDEEVMDPRRQGQFVHGVFEKFFDAWQNAGHHAITLQNLDAARSLFTAIVDESLTALSEAEAGLERTRLLGSPAAAGLGEAVMRMEAERPTPVVQRLLEHRLEGEFTFATPDGPRQLAVSGKADRIDLLADGTFRLIDYKLGWPPDRRRALQLSVYSVCAEQSLRGHRGRSWTLGEATYLAFKGPRRVVPLFTTPADREKVLADAQDRLVKTIDAINAGHFPPTPDDVYRCETCSYTAVCRKDYVGDV